MQHRPAISIEHIALNTQAAPLTDVDVRRALAYATDRAGIVHGLLKGQVPVLNSGPTLVPAVPGYVPAFARYTYDPARAAAILTGDGWARGGDGIFAKDGKRLSITVSYVPTNAQRRINLTFLAQRARAAGIELVPTPDPNLYSSSLPKGAFQAAEFGFSGSVDPSQSSLLGADQVPTAANDYSGQNIYRYTGVGALAERSDYIVSDPRGVPASAPFGGPGPPSRPARHADQAGRRCAVHPAVRDAEHLRGQEHARGTADQRDLDRPVLEHGDLVLQGRQGLTPGDAAPGPCRPTSFAAWPSASRCCWSSASSCTSRSTRRGTRSRGSARSRASGPRTCSGSSGSTTSTSRGTAATGVG